ncbi:MAG: tetratricopeptide repeat protein [Planctomycetota bacterium]|jgi:Flp pilus assembly protein TadD
MMRPGHNTAQSNVEQKKANWEWLVLAGILALGMLLRVAYLRVLVKEPGYAFPMGDMRVHDYWARALATGDWTPPPNLPEVQLQKIPFLRPPGYPYFLALIYRALGAGYLAPRIVQMALGLLSVVLAFQLGRSLFGRIPALIFAAFMSVYWGFIYFEGELHYPAMVIFLILAIVNVLRLWTEKFTYPRVVAAGVLLGICVLTSPSMLLLLPVILVWGWWVARRRTEQKRYVLMGLVFAAATVLVVAPASVRNYVVADDLVFISCSGGLAIYCANNEVADAVNARLPGLEKLTGGASWGWLTYPLIVRGVQREQARPMKYSEVSAYFVKKAFKYVRENPGRTLGRVAAKAALFWGPVEVTDNKVVHYDRQNSAVLRYCPGFSVFLALCIVGFGVVFFDLRAARKTEAAMCSTAARQVEICLLIFLFVAAYFVSFLPVMASARYRLPIVPFILLFGAYAVSRLVQFISKRNWRKLAGCVFVGAAVYLQVSKPLVAYEPLRAKWHVGRGVSYQSSGKLDQAVAEYQQAVRLLPNFYRAQMSLATLLSRQARYGEAVSPAREAVRLKPDSAEAHMILGQALAETGQADEGISHLMKAVDLAPDHFYAHYNLGVAWARKREFDKAMAHLERARQLKPDNARVYTMLASTLAARNKTGEAIQMLHEALRLEPTDAEARRLLEQLASQQGIKQ